MSIESRSRQYGNVFGSWQIQDLLIKGPGEKTAAFRLSQTEGEDRSVLQICNLITEQGSLDTLPADHQDRYKQARQECQDAAEREVQQHFGKPENPNIPIYLDHTFVDWSDETGFGCDMLIRMALPEDEIGKLYDEQAADSQYQSAKDFLDALNRLALPGAQQEDNAPVHEGQEASSASDSTANVDTTPHAKFSNFKPLIIAASLFLLIGIAMFFLLGTARTQKAVAGIMEDAQALAATANYEDAILTIQEGLVEYPDSDDLQDTLEIYTTSLTEQNISSIITEADALVSGGNLVAATEKIEEGLTTYPDSERLQYKQTEYDNIYTEAKARTISDTDQYVKQGDYLSAIHMLGQVMLIIGEDDDLSGMLQEYKDAYASDVLEKAAFLADQKYYAQALDILISAEDEIGSNSDIDANISILSIQRQQQLESAEISLDVPNYKQTDSRWASIRIGSETIRNVGCLLTSLAMKYSYSTGENVYPNVMISKLCFLGDDVYWSSIEALGYTYSDPYNTYLTNSMMEKIYTQLDAGKPVIIGGQNSSGNTHYVIITGYTNTSASSFKAADFTINDPNSEVCVTLAQFICNYPVVIRLIY